MFDDIFTDVFLTPTGENVMDDKYQAVPINEPTTETAVTALTVPEQNTKELIEQMLGSANPQCLHNFPGDAREQFKLINVAESGGMVDRQTVGNDSFPMTYFYAHKVRLVDDETGQIFEPTRVVLMNKDREGVAFVSDGIASALGKIIQTFGIGPYDPPLDVKIQEIKTRRGRRLYTLLIV